MIRVVIDTNVLVSGILTPRGHEAAVLDLIGDGVLTWSLSEPILQEYRRVLLDKLHFDPAHVQWYFDLVAEAGEVYEPVMTLSESPQIVNAKQLRELLGAEA